MAEIADNYSAAVSQYNKLMSDPDFVNKYNTKWIAVSKNGDYVIGSDETRTADVFLKCYPNDIQYYIGPVGGDPNNAGAVHRK
jgi:hypothetical protein